MNVGANWVPLSFNKCVGTPYGITQLSRNTDAACILVILVPSVTVNAIFIFAYWSVSPKPSWLPERFFGRGPQMSILISFIHQMLELILVLPDDVIECIVLQTIGSLRRPCIRCYRNESSRVLSVIYVPQLSSFRMRSKDWKLRKIQEAWLERCWYFLVYCSVFCLYNEDTFLVLWVDRIRLTDR